jgi:hypothetical protein
LLGAGITAADLPDVALGRALDKVAVAGGATVFSAVAARALCHDQVWTPDAALFVHWDSTTGSVYGTYPAGPPRGGRPAHVWPFKRSAPRPAANFLTLLGTRGGHPPWGNRPAGERQRQATQCRHAGRVADHFPPEQPQQLVYVADPALVTGPHRATLATRDLRFVSRLPETFGAATTAKTAAWAADAGIPVGRIGVRADAATYHSAERTGVIDERPGRLRRGIGHPLTAVSGPTESGSRAVPVARDRRGLSAS